MKLTESTFLLYAAKYYENPHCSDISEFEEDLKRLQYLRKLFSRFKQTGELKERLILNHLIILYNCFGTETTNILFMKNLSYLSYKVCHSITVSSFIIIPAHYLHGVTHYHSGVCIKNARVRVTYYIR